MAIVCWGNLAKSADSVQRIEQSIQAYIESHDENPNAHMGEDYALGAHRLSVVMDHADGAVHFYHLAKDSILGFTLFESLDGWTQYGKNSDAGIFSARITTPVNPNGDNSAISAFTWAGGPGFDPNKNAFFQSTVCLISSTYQIAYIVAGDYPAEGTTDCVGFKITNGTVYAFWTSGLTEYSQLISGITVTQTNCYRFKIDSLNKTIQFYVNGVLKYTSTINFPSIVSNSFAMYFIQRSSSVARVMRVVDYVYEQDR